MSVTRQLSLFGVEASAPQPGDLAGLLLANGQITRRGAGARVSVVVDHPWRASALVTECARRGVAATCVATPDEHIGVRTAYSPSLVALAEAWLQGSVTRAPAGLRLDGHQLRLWVQAAGRRDTATSYALSLGRHDVPARDPIGAALCAVGLAVQLIVPRGERHCSYRIVGRRRLARLVELIGDPPSGAPAAIWPS